MLIILLNNSLDFGILQKVNLADFNI